MGKVKSFWIAVFGIEEESKWLHSEQVNIFITAIIPAVLSLVGLVITCFEESKCHLSLKAVLGGLGNEVFINSMQLIVIICTLLVTYRIRHNILVTGKKTRRLQTYIKNECDLRDKSPEKVESTLTVVRRTVSQFYFFWIAFWVTLLLYYSCDLCFSILNTIPFNLVEKNVHGLEITENSFYNFFNYVSSTILFAMFIILNSVTVSLSERRTGKYGVVSAISIMVVFGCVIIYTTMYSSALSGLSYLQLNLFTMFVLGMYSAITFILFLGKLNTNLQIPRFIFYWLYIYALVQVFQFMFINVNGLEDAFCSCGGNNIVVYSSNCIVRVETIGCHSICCPFAGIIRHLGVFRIIFQYITLVGKVFLSLTLVWIAYDSRFIHFVLRQSQAITDLKYRMNVFKTYMRDV